MTGRYDRAQVLLTLVVLALLAFQWVVFWSPSTDWWVSAFKAVGLVATAISALACLHSCVRTTRRVVLRPLPFPVPDCWPELAEHLNAVNQITEDLGVPAGNVTFMTLGEQS